MPAYRRLHAPHPRLRDIVNCYFVEVARAGPMLYPATPSASITVFASGASVHPGGVAHTETLMCRPQRSAVWATLLPGTTYVSVVFRPGQIRRVMPRGATAAYDDGSPLEAVFARAAVRALVDSVRRAPTLDRAVAALEDWLTMQAHVAEERGGGGIRLPPACVDAPRDALAAQLGRGPRQLERLFVDTFGASQRDMRSLLRYARTLSRLIAADFSLPALSGMAIDCGYYDHAQMTRHFRRYAGMAPVQLAAAVRDAPQASMAMYRYEHADKRILLDA
ncbi:MULTISPECIES: helix-turn-helix domain-containing protein [unclassified Burkholderia]|uniref:helix-turn-helix domain-containing protein n=1 Tax=unclassified Burkholderia TaxID=2613784 RepID=UPI000753089B|nr:MULTISPECIES: helix-turn-helix domain-containing protein [unclassified Burkholderia]KVN09104.1 transcriptional regulator [Burkholderia sp. MSMB1552]KWZ57087.1 transcriptional regulator [Burkholderia sp. MSMB1588]